MSEDCGSVSEGERRAWSVRAFRDVGAVVLGLYDARGIVGIDVVSVQVCADVVDWLKILADSIFVGHQVRTQGFDHALE